MLVEIEKLKIRIGDKKVSLSVEEAQALRDELNEVLGANGAMWISTLPIIIDPPYYPGAGRVWITSSDSTAIDSSWTAVT
jgi:hypothetical protein